MSKRVFEVFIKKWTSPLNKLQATAYDPPLFYGAPFLVSFSQKENVSISFAVLHNGAEWLIAIPLIENIRGIWSNVTSRGWDNLKPIQAKNATQEDLDLFWKNILAQYSNLQLVNFSEKAIKHLPKTKFSITQQIFKCPYIDLTSVESIESIVSTSFHKKIKREVRVANRDAFAFETIDFDQLTIDERISKYNTLLELHSKRFKEKDETSVFLSSDNVSTHTNLLKQKSLRGVFIEGTLNGNSVSSFYCFLTTDRMVYFNSGIEPSLGKYSLGTVSIFYMITYCLENNIHYLDFLRGTEAYKKHWSKDYNQNYSVFISDGNFLDKLKLSMFFIDSQINRLGRMKAMKVVIKALRNEKIEL